MVIVAEWHKRKLRGKAEEVGSKTRVPDKRIEWAMAELVWKGERREERNSQLGLEVRLVLLSLVKRGKGAGKGSLHKKKAP